MIIHRPQKLRDSLSELSQTVPDVGDTPPEFSPCPMEVSDDGVRHAVRMFSEQHGPGEFGTTIPRLHLLYEKENHDFYDGKLPSDPLILIGTSRSFGWYRYRNQWGGQHEIGIADKVFHRNNNKYLRRTDETESGFIKFIDDIMRHEMVHLYNSFVLDESESSYHGHGPAFARQCNDVGRQLNLPPVKSCRDRKRGNIGVPSCSSWPSCVRPEDYYEGAWLTGDDDDEDEIDDLDANAMQYLMKVAKRCNPTDNHLRLLGQAAITACRLRFGMKVLPKHSTEIPFSEFCVI